LPTAYIILSIFRLPVTRSVTPRQMTKSGVSTSVRRLFAVAVALQFRKS